MNCWLGWGKQVIARTQGRSIVHYCVVRQSMTINFKSPALWSKFLRGNKFIKRKLAIPWGIILSSLYLCFVETESWSHFIPVLVNKLSPTSWADHTPYLTGEHDGPGNLEHGVGPRGLWPAGAHQGQQVGGAQQRNQDHQGLQITEDRGQVRTKESLECV